ncbi:putative phosphatase YcdX [Terrisporobacter petrolearius]|uniref:Phosphatase YcdX n=1 Tax=Terrisporobacter petrolearius TaxID=1460447 RepID=A0ABZ3F9N1_9FIRM
MKGIIDLHTHALSSGHAYSTVKENIEYAKINGLKYYGLSDHGINMPGGPHLFYFQNLKVLPREIDGVRILKGMEANVIDYDGKIDVEIDKYIKGLDYIIASLHTVCLEPGTKEENTRATLNAMDHELVKIIGHPDDGRYLLDYEAIVKKAKEKNILLEVNNSSLNPGSFRPNARENYIELLNLCKEHQVRIILGSDAHICYQVGIFDNAEKLLDEVDFPKELVINYHEDEILKFFQL